MLSSISILSNPGNCAECSPNSNSQTPSFTVDSAWCRTIDISRKQHRDFVIGVQEHLADLESDLLLARVVSILFLPLSWSIAVTYFQLPQVDRQQYPQHHPLSPSSPSKLKKKHEHSQDLQLRKPAQIQTRAIMLRPMGSDTACQMQLNEAILQRCNCDCDAVRGKGAASSASWKNL